jgi:hypothetical protein
MFYNRLREHKEKLLFLLILIFSLIMNEGCSSGGYTLNYGLSKPQDPSTLPKSVAPAPVTVLKPKVTAITRLQPLRDGEYSILNGWELIEASKIKKSDSLVSMPGLNTTCWYNATVPGTVLTTLVDEGVYPDPYYGLNNLYIPDSLCREDWWYRASFRIPDREGNGNVWLNFNGINYKAEVWLNGILLGKIEGAFKRGIFNASGIINKTGENILAVHIFPPLHPGIPHEKSPAAGVGPNGGQLCLDGPTFISSEGWDWIPGIRDRDMGIWQDVVLKLTGPVTIIDPQVITSLPLPDTNSAEITINMQLYNSGTRAERVLLKGKIENILFEKSVEVAAGGKMNVSFTPLDYPQLRINNPRLWWPNQYGNPELYNLKLTALSENGLSDLKSVRFGIREMSYEFMVSYPDHTNKRIAFDPVKNVNGDKLLFNNINRTDVGNGVTLPGLREDADTTKLLQSEDPDMGPYLVIKVNGKRIYCRGGSWGMDDAMKKISRSRLEPYFRLHKEEHFNMIRNWTGESTEDVFYSLADEYGLLVWNDFWMSTEGYNIEPLDKNLFLENVKDVIKRYRNHPSIALWCPRNEGYAPVTMEDAIAKIIAAEDRTRYYQPNSRYMNLTPSGPWNYVKDPSYYADNIARGFDTEVGTPSTPTAVSLKKMMAHEDVWPISDVWYYHDLHKGLQDYRNAANSLYGLPESFEDFNKKIQMINYDSFRNIFESWNSKLWNNTSGVLLWMSHPAWPSVIWQTYSWDYGVYGSFYGSQKACEPVHIQMNPDDGKVVVVNSSLKTFNNLIAKSALYNLHGILLYQNQDIVNVKANELTTCFLHRLPADLPDIYLVRVSLTDKDGTIISLNDYWKSKNKNKDFLDFNKLPDVKLSAEIIRSDKGDDNTLIINIANPSITPALGVNLHLVDNAGNILLPVYISDGFFNLLPGENKQIKINYPVFSSLPKGITADGYNIIRDELVKIK